MRTAVKLGLVTLLALVLSACSSTTFFYNRLDFLIPWYVGKYVHLQHDQKKLLRRSVDDFLEWHRREELPAYKAWVAKAQADLDGELSPAQLQQMGDEFDAAWSRIEQHSLEWMIALGETLSDEQMAEFLGNLREEQAEMVEDDLERDDAQYRHDLRDRIEDRLGDYLGRLDKNQKQILQDAVRELQRADGVWLSERQRWLERLAVLLQREPGWQDALRSAVANQEAFNSPEYHAVFDHNAQVIYAALADVLNARGERQDKRLRGKLEDLGEDLETLIAQGLPAGSP